MTITESVEKRLIRSTDFPKTLGGIHIFDKLAKIALGCVIYKDTVEIDNGSGRRDP